MESTIDTTASPVTTAAPITPAPVEAVEELPTDEETAPAEPTTAPATEEKAPAPDPEATDLTVYDLKDLKDPRLYVKYDDLVKLLSETAEKYQYYDFAPQTTERNFLAPFPARTYGSLMAKVDSLKGFLTLEGYVPLFLFENLRLNDVFMLGWTIARVHTDDDKYVLLSKIIAKTEEVHNVPTAHLVLSPIRFQLKQLYEARKQLNDILGLIPISNRIAASKNLEAVLTEDTVPYPHPKLKDLQDEYSKELEEAQSMSAWMWFIFKTFGGPYPNYFEVYHTGAYVLLSDLRQDYLPKDEGYKQIFGLYQLWRDNFYYQLSAMSNNIGFIYNAPKEEAKEEEAPKEEAKEEVSKPNE